MGSSQDIMHQFARQEINRFFSTYDGWTITPLPEAGGYDREFIAERTISGNKESKKVLVSFEKNVKKEKIEGMRSSVTGPYGQVQKSDVLRYCSAEFRHLLRTFRCQVVVHELICL